MGNGESDYRIIKPIWTHWKPTKTNKNSWRMPVHQFSSLAAIYDLDSWKKAATVTLPMYSLRLRA
ncbi:MAG: hypothetical protein PVS3B3_13750 [Ktedonobacteraceae bacterium]